MKSRIREVNPTSRREPNSVDWFEDSSNASMKHSAFRWRERNIVFETALNDSSDLEVWTETAHDFMPGVEPFSLCFCRADLIGLAYLAGQVEKRNNHCKSTRPLAGCTDNLPVHNFIALFGEIPITLLHNPIGQSLHYLDE